MATSIDVKLLYCKDIHSFTFFQKLSVYALAALGPADPKAKDRRLQLQKSPVSRDGGNNPEWNHPIRFDLEKIADPDLRSLFLEIDLVAPSRFFPDKLVGEVRVPLTDLLQGADGSARSVSYQVRNTDGKHNGVFSFSYQVNLKDGKIASYPKIKIDPPLAYPAVEIDSPPAVYYLAPPPPPPLPAVNVVPLAQPVYFPPLASPPPAPMPMPMPDPYGFQPAGPYAYPPPAGYPTLAPQPGPWAGDTWRDRGYGGYFNGWGRR